MRKIIIGFIVLIFSFAVNTFNLCGAEISLPAGEKVGFSLASWYGPNFHGKKTASGQIFDMHGFTCAHKKYPFGTWLKITNVVSTVTLKAADGELGVLPVTVATAEIA